MSVIGKRYAWYDCREEIMARPIRFIRKSYFVDTATLRRARKALGTSSDAETVRQAVEHVADMAAFRTFMRKARASVRPGSFERD